MNDRIVKAVAKKKIKNKQKIVITELTIQVTNVLLANKRKRLRYWWCCAEYKLFSTSNRYNRRLCWFVFNEFFDVTDSQLKLYI